jgi:integrase/recombinase XerD
VKNGAGKWRYVSIEEGQGKRTGGLLPPFYVRPVDVNGKQFWHRLTRDEKTSVATYAEAKEVAERGKIIRDAEKKGLTVEQASDPFNENRVPLVAAVKKFLDDCEGAGRKPKTLVAYRLALANFEAALKPKTVRFLDEITLETLKGHVKFLRDAGYSPKSIANQTTTVAGFLNEILGKGKGPRIRRKDRPPVQKRIPEAYTKEELEAIFAAMDDEERIRFRFFLKTACREQEVQFATWKDIDFNRKVFTVRAKEDVEFTPKDHDEREIPLRDDLVEELKRHKRKQEGKSLWIFPSKDGQPEGHFLRMLKDIALRAGLNCGRCKTTLTVGEYKAKRKVEVKCKTHAVCKNWQVHKFRKTCATRWEAQGVKVSKIQRWLGHESLSTTERYLGLGNEDDDRKRINSGE